MYPLVNCISGDGYTYTANLTQAGGADYTYDGGQVEGNPFIQRFKVKRAIATPTIISFSISKTVSTSGDLITLVPVFSGGTATIGTAGAGSTQVTSSATSGGGYNVYPSSNTTYTLTVGGSVSDSKSVVVWPVPTVTSLTPTSYYVTKDAYIELTPVFNNGGGSGYGTINGAYVYTGSNYGWYPGTVPVTTYTLLSVNAAGASASLNTYINVYNFPYNLSLTGSPSSIVTGDSSTLTASFDDSTCAAKIGTTGVGSSNITASIAKGGTVVVSPIVTTTYTLTVTNGAGSYTSTTKVITVTSGCGAYCRLDGACCPGPDVPVTMSDNTKKPAKDVKVGDKVISWNEKLDLFEIEEVTDVEYADNHRFELFLDNGKSGLFAKNHRFLTGAGEWKELQNLKVDEELSNFVRVSKITDAGIGPVVKLTVNQNHTYLTLGIVSHNLKGLD